MGTYGKALVSLLCRFSRKAELLLGGKFGVVRCCRTCSVCINRFSALHLSLSQTNYSFSDKKIEK